MALDSEMNQFPQDPYDLPMNPTTYVHGYQRLLQEDPDVLPTYSESSQPTPTAPPSPGFNIQQSSNNAS